MNSNDNQVRPFLPDEPFASSSAPQASKAGEEEGKPFGYDCPVCGEPLIDNQDVRHTDEGLTHEACCTESPALRAKPEPGEQAKSLEQAFRDADEVREEKEVVSDNADSPRQNELLPCPFCGSEASTMKCPSGHGQTLSVFCADSEDCGAEMTEWIGKGATYTMEEVIARWNKRAGQSVSGGGSSDVSGVSFSKVAAASSLPRQEGT